jgi:hypothetical protein
MADFDDGDVEEIEEFVEEAGAGEESDTERDGFMSYSGETHAAVNGFAKGFMLRPMDPSAHDSKKEIAYFRGFYVVARIAHIMLIVTASIIVLLFVLVW